MGLLICVGLCSNSPPTLSWWIPATGRVTGCPNCVLGKYGEWCLLIWIEKIFIMSAAFSDFIRRRNEARNFWALDSRALVSVSAPPWQEKRWDLGHVPLHFLYPWLLIFKMSMIALTTHILLVICEARIPTKTRHNKYSLLLLPQPNEQILLEGL